MYYQVFQDIRNEWRWRLRAANHQIIATSGEGYVSKTDCLTAISYVKASANALVYDA